MSAHRSFFFMYETECHMLCSPDVTCHVLAPIRFTLLEAFILIFVSWDSKPGTGLTSNICRFTVHTWISCGIPSTAYARHELSACIYRCSEMFLMSLASDGPFFRLWDGKLMNEVKCTMSLYFFVYFFGNLSYESLGWPFFTYVYMYIFFSEIVVIFFIKPTIFWFS